MYIQVLYCTIYILQKKEQVLRDHVISCHCVCLSVLVKQMMIPNDNLSFIRVIEND